MIPSAVAVDALIAHLRNKLSASVATVNSTRLNRIVALRSEPYVLATGTWFIGVGESPDPEDFASCWSVDAGPYTAAQLASHLYGRPADFEPGTSYPGIVNFSSAYGRLVVSDSTASGPLVVLGTLSALLTPPIGNVATVLGVPADGLVSDIAPIIAPSYEGICDGFPLLVPDMGSGFWVIIGDREAVPDDGSSLRRDSWTVRTSLHIMRPSYANERHRTREPISACLDAVRRCLLTDEGRQLGKAVTGEIQIVEITSERVGGTALRFEEMQNVLFDTASLDVAIRVYQRPSST